ncbi:MAG: hypothetical protein LH631_12010 [Alkalinema sp. CAN_BIN05]|nr:hypothetical protein [Alkalinema sp. CAN_BIN05]
MHQVSSQKTTVSAMLHPQVKLALAYLDCHLEDELLRYRRARSGSQVAPSSARAMRSSNKAKTPAQVELTQFIAIDALPKKAIAVDSDIPAQTDNLSAEEILSGLAVNDDATYSENSFSSEDEYSLDDLMANSGVEISGDRSLYLPSHLPNDYLESSEELLRSLAQEEAGAEQERSSIESLLTPLGIGSMMLMLIGSGMFGYLVMNPSTLTALGSAASRLMSGVKLPQSAPSVTAPAAVAVNGEVPTDSNEFVDLSLNNLVVMGTQGQGLGLLKMPAPIAPNIARTPSGLMSGIAGNKAGAPIGIPTNPSQPASQSNGSAAKPSQPGSTPPIVVQPPAQRPSLYRPVQPKKQSSPYRTPTKTVPVLIPAPSSPTAIPSSESATTPATGGYRVEIPYTGDTALEKAQKSDPGAYFKNGENGAVIQMGESYTSREAADAKAQQLKQQGFDGVEVQK